MPWSKVAILGMVIPPLIGNPYNGYINPYYWVDFSHPLLCGKIGSLDPSTYHIIYDHIWFTSPDEIPKTRKHCEIERQSWQRIASAERLARIMNPPKTTCRNQEKLDWKVACKIKITTVWSVKCAEIIWWVVALIISCWGTSSRD